MPLSEQVLDLHMFQDSGQLVAFLQQNRINGTGRLGHVDETYDEGYESTAPEVAAEAAATAPCSPSSQAAGGPSSPGRTKRPSRYTRSTAPSLTVIAADAAVEAQDAEAEAEAVADWVACRGIGAGHRAQAMVSVRGSGFDGAPGLVKAMLLRHNTRARSHRLRRPITDSPSTHRCTAMVRFAIR